MRPNPTPRQVRRGFTLIELIAVIAVIAVLAALTIGAIGKIRVAQTERDTTTRLASLHVGLDAMRAAIVQTCKEARKKRTDEFTALTNFCGGDEDRAESLYIFMQLRNKMPMTFAEASTDTVLGGVTLRRSPAFASLAALPGQLPEQSAALLFIILSEKSLGGVSFQADNQAKSEVAIGANRYPVFIDSWSSPIAFSRYAQNGELEGTDYAKGPAGQRDPFDIKGKLAALPAASRAPAEVVVFSGQSQFNGQNRVITAISAGPDRTFDVLANWQTSDDIYSYRKREGTRAE